jgi:hypothetical protein
MHSAFYKCLHKDKVIEMKYKDEIAGDETKIFNLEKKMQEIIISAPDNNNNNSNNNVNAVCLLIG